MAHYTSRPLIVKLQVAIKEIRSSIVEVKRDVSLSAAERFSKESAGHHLLASCLKRLQVEYLRELSDLEHDE